MFDDGLQEPIPLGFDADGKMRSLNVNPALFDKVVDFHDLHPAQQKVLRFNERMRQRPEKERLEYTIALKPDGKFFA